MCKLDPLVPSSGTTLRKTHKNAFIFDLIRFGLHFIVRMASENCLVVTEMLCKLLQSVINRASLNTGLPLTVQSVFVRINNRHLYVVWMKYTNPQNFSLKTKFLILV